MIYLLVSYTTPLTMPPKKKTIPAPVANTGNPLVDTPAANPDLFSAAVIASSGAGNPWNQQTRRDYINRTGYNLKIPSNATVSVLTNLILAIADGKPESHEAFDGFRFVSSATSTSSTKTKDELYPEYVSLWHTVFGETREGGALPAGSVPARFRLKPKNITKADLVAEMKEIEEYEDKQNFMSQTTEELNRQYPGMTVMEALTKHLNDAAL